MAGETIKTQGICLRISPWSRTSHVVTWLTPRGPVATVVKGAVRPKSAFLGQYDLNYTCELLYYARGLGEARTLKECSPLTLRSSLRDDWRAFMLSDRFRALCALLSPTGTDAEPWFALLSSSLDAVAENSLKAPEKRIKHISFLIDFELKVLSLAGLAPEISPASGFFELRGERKIPLSQEVARCLLEPFAEKNPKILLDAARVIGVFYTFHLDCAPDGRRLLPGMIEQ